VPEIFIGGGSVTSGAPTTPTNPLSPLLWSTLLLQGFGSTEGMALQYRVVDASTTDSSSYTAAAVAEAAFIVGFKMAVAGGGGGSAERSFTYIGG